MVSWRGQWEPRGSGGGQWGPEGLSGSRGTWGGPGRGLGGVSGGLMVSQLGSSGSQQVWHGRGVVLSRVPEGSVWSLGPKGLSGLSSFQWGPSYGPLVPEL